MDDEDRYSRMLRAAEEAERDRPARFLDLTNSESRGMLVECSHCGAQFTFDEDGQRIPAKPPKPAGLDDF